MAPSLRRAKRSKNSEASGRTRATSSTVASDDGHSPLRRSMSEATRRVDEVIDAAEKAAAEIRAEAKQESERPKSRRGRTSQAPPQSAASTEAAGRSETRGRPLRQSMADAKRRVEQVIDAAESAAAEIRAEAEAEASRLIEARRKEAAEIRAEAEAEAGRYLAARRVGADRLVQARERAISELSRSLLGHAERLREQAEALATEFEQTVARIRESPDSEGQTGGDTAVGYSPATQTGETEPGTEPVADSEAAAAESPPAYTPRRSAETDGVPEAAMLRATQMAVEGVDRTEIDRVLRKKFGLTETDAVLDEILGDEG